MLSASSNSGVSQYRAVVILPEIDSTTNAKVLDIQERVQEIPELPTNPVPGDHEFTGFGPSNGTLREGDIPAWIRRTPMTAADAPIPTLFAKKSAAPRKKKDVAPSLETSEAPDTGPEVVPNDKAKDDSDKATEGCPSPYC
jgi:hypothetical protein